MLNAEIISESVLCFISYYLLSVCCILCSLKIGFSNKIWSINLIAMWCFSPVRHLGCELNRCDYSILVLDYVLYFIVTHLAL